MSNEHADFSRRAYPSDISRRQWERVGPLLSRPRDEPAGRGRPGRKRCTDLREVVNAVNYRWHTGCVWRMLPHDFPPWGTVYRYFREWERAGLLPAVRGVLTSRAPGASQTPAVERCSIKASSSDFRRGRISS